jgi:hypothetical protein
LCEKRCEKEGREYAGDETHRGNHE